MTDYLRRMPVYEEEDQGIKYKFQWHNPRRLEVPKYQDDLYWYISPLNSKLYRKWRVFATRKDFEKYFMKKNGVVPRLVEDWYEAEEMDWVLGDDGGCCEVVAKGEKYIRTVVGTFVIRPNGRKNYKTDFMDTDFNNHPSRYRFNTKWYPTIEAEIKARRKLTLKERRFVINVAHGMDVVEAFKKCYYTKDTIGEKTIIKRAMLLYRQERVKKAMAKELKDIAKECGLDDTYVFKRLKHMHEYAEDETIQFKTLQEIGKAIGTLEPDNKKMQGGGVMAYMQSFETEDVKAFEAKESKKIKAPEWVETTTEEDK